ncbi:MAG TPA: hypothetical protein VEK85_10265 [Gemmatimonadales bacterium]|nr:hypothetical protein [Gemmatimonadales bacterium]
MRKITWKPGAFTPRRVEECVACARQVGYREIMLWTNDVLYAARQPAAAWELGW